VRWNQFVALSLIVDLALATAPSIALGLNSSNNTPFPTSKVITGASWSSARHGPPSNQFGDILPTTWADDGNLYVLMDDGGTDAPGGGALWRNSFARITGMPLANLQFQRIGNPPPAATRAQIRGNRARWSGALGHHYANGFTSVEHVFYATQVQDWNWNANSQFAGLAGIAYSTDRGQSWRFPAKRFPGPSGSLNWVQWGQDAPAPDGYVYAIASNREFNGGWLVLGRSRPNIRDMTDPARWQWASGLKSVRGRPRTVWSSSFARALAIVSWPGHITYPRMSYDVPLHRYLLTFTYSFAATPPAIWRNGSELVMLEAPHPWGPFSFVARGDYFGPSNGYDPAFPEKWISANGQDLWMIYAANFAGCAAGLPCSGGYGFNYQRIHLTLAAHRASEARQRPASGPPRPLPPGRALTRPSTLPPFELPRLYLSPGR
jgi:hypothetical protein